jgi:hypothetical protein
MVSDSSQKNVNEWQQNVQNKVAAVDTDVVILYFIRTTDKVQKTIGSQCYIPSSEPFRIY